MKRDERRAFWRQHIDAWRQSDKSQAAYCRLNHLEYHAFARWRSLLAEMADVKTAGPFVQVVTAATSTGELPCPLSSTLTIEAALEVAGGIKVILPSMTGPELGTLIAALRSALG